MYALLKQLHKETSGLFKSTNIHNEEVIFLNNITLFLFAGDLNITFADSNLLLEEAKDSHVLSAALIAALSFGILFFFVVLVLIGKRCFDRWQRRHYSRVDKLPGFLKVLT
jgi:hypothetical protein